MGGHVIGRPGCSPTAATTSTSTAACSGLGGITPKIARRGASHGPGLGKTRWAVERPFAWLHQFKRLRIRYEIRADLHLGLLRLACSIIC
ncbi:transposase [Streptomyces sp. NPDC003016]